MTTLSSRLGSELRFRFSSSAFAEDKFDVVNLEGFEAISRPYRFTLTLVSDDAQIDFDAMLKNTATLCINSPDGTQEVPYHGVIAQFEQLQQAGNYFFYRAVLVPRLWHLSLYQISEVYLNEQTIPQIIESILKGSQFSSQDYAFSLSGDYRQRSFVCQFEESHLDFISRWMEKEGLYYFFDHGAAKGGVDKLLIADAVIAHPAATVDVKYRPADELDTGVFADCVQDFSCRQKPLPRRVIVQDYNYRKAALTLRAEAQVAADGVGDVMLYGENFRTVVEGQRYAKLRAEEIVCRSRVFAAESTAVGLRSGYFLALSHHYRDDFNGRYLVTEIHHRGSQAGVLLAGLKTPFSAAERGTRYANSFSAIAAVTQFRAERLTPKPRIAGTMNATIDAEGSGDYAELDEFGQYKVQLPFDLTDKDANKGSTRIRMATPYSGSDHGMHFPLLKSAEVLLSFVDGDPDQPVIMGAIPNSENRSVVNNANPAANQIRTKGGNHLHMSDVKGKTGMALHSPKGNTSILLGSSGSDGGDGGEGGGSGLTFLTIGGSEELIVGNDYAATIGMTNYTYIGTENTVNVGLENSVKVGGEFAYAYGSKVEWTNVGGYSLEDGEVIELGDTVSKQAGQSLTFAAGYGITAEAEAAALATLKKGVKAAVLTMTGLNVALGVATSALLLAQSGGASEQGNLGEKGNSWVPIAESAGEAAIVAAGAGAVYLALNLAIKALAHTYEHLAKVSTLKMDATGITQTVNLPTANSELRMSALGISLSDVDDAGLEAFMTLQSGAATVCADAVTVKGESVKVGQVEVGDLTSGLSANEAEVVLKNADTAVTLTALTAGIKSPEISIIADAVNGFVVNATETQMSFGGAGVRASLAGLKLSMDGAGVLVFQPGVVSVDAIGVLKLG